MRPVLNDFKVLKGNVLTEYNNKKYEYNLGINKFNDGLEDARELWEFAKQVPCKINIIEYNPISQADFVNAEADAIAAFSGFLESKRMVVNVRRSRGKDIDAACGQLAGKK